MLEPLQPHRAADRIAGCDGGRRQRRELAHSIAGQRERFEVRRELEPAQVRDPESGQVEAPQVDAIWLARIGSCTSGVPSSRVVTGMPSARATAT